MSTTPAEASAGRDSASASAPLQTAGSPASATTASTKPVRLSRGQLAAYAALAVPLAAAALPVYVHVPKLYAGELGLDLAAVGAILLTLRLFDAVQDPLLGWFSDRWSARFGNRRALIALALPVLAGGLAALFHPPALGGAGLLTWLAASLAITYLGFSTASIGYQAWGAELARDTVLRTRVTATREGAALIGVLLAAALPDWLAARYGQAGGVSLFGLLYLPLLAMTATITLTLSPCPVTTATMPPREPWSKATLAPFANAPFRRLLAIFVVSGIAAAIPATLFLFYVEDVLGAVRQAGMFLLVYFVCAAAGMPIWVRVSARFGKQRAWFFGMLLSVAGFIGAALLGSGDTAAFAVVCAITGFALGADLALAPSLLADVIDCDSRYPPNQQQAPVQGAYFGLWNLATKLSLALAAGIALPLLAVLGYQAGSAQQAFGPLSALYALLPCALRLVAAAILWRAPFDRISGHNP